MYSKLKELFDVMNYLIHEEIQINIQEFEKYALIVQGGVNKFFLEKVVKFRPLTHAERCIA